MEEQLYRSVDQTLGITTAGDLGTHTFVVPEVALNKRVVVLEDLEKNCNVLCGPKRCTGRCGREASGIKEHWRVREGLEPDAPDQFQPHHMSEFDICHFNSLTGIIQIMLRISICLSVACCLGRSDFSLPVLLYSYYEWSICGDWHHEAKIYRVEDNVPVSHIYERTSGLLVANPSTIRGVGLSAFLLSMVVAVNVVWLLLASAVWTCIFAPGDDCLSGGLLQTHGLHSVVLALSFVNLLLMAAITGASWVWLRIQKRASQFLESIAI